MAKKPSETELTDVVDNEDILLNEEMEEIEGKKKKKKKEKKPKKEKDDNKNGFPIIPVIVLLIIAGGITAVFVLNLYGVRDIVTNYLAEAPLIGQYFIASTAEPEEGNEETNRFAAMTPEELYAEFTAKEYEIERLESDLSAAEEQVDTQEETIAFLQEFERQIEAYRDVKERFDQIVVEGGTPEENITFYETISPENAERLYQESLNEAQYNDDIREQAAVFAEMDSGIAAQSLEEMLRPNTDLVLALLREMAIEDRAAIFDEMEPDLVARINNLLEPVVPEDVPVATAPPLPEGIPESNDVQQVTADDGEVQ